MAASFKEVLENWVGERIAQGEDPKELFDELAQEANLVFGHYRLEYELGLFTKEAEEG